MGLFAYNLSGPGQRRVEVDNLQDSLGADAMTDGISPYW